MNNQTVRNNQTVKYTTRQGWITVLAKNTCHQCNGYGLHKGLGNYEVICNCVFRKIFNICLRKYQQCLEEQKYVSKVSLDFCKGKNNRRAYGRKNEEYLADFVCIAKRTLSPTEYKVFYYHFLKRMQWKTAAPLCQLQRGNFFHNVYLVEQKLGNIFLSLEPYGLYPIREYFGVTFLYYEIRLPSS